MIKPTGAGLTNVLLLYSFGTAIALYPPLAQFAQPFIFLSFLAILFSVMYGIVFLRRPIPNSILFKITGILSFVYVTWLFIAAVYGNDMTYMMQDSLGFVIYLLTPVIYIFIQSNNLHQHLFRFLLNLCIFLAVLSVGILSWYYVSFGSVQGESLAVINAFIKSYNLNWQIDNNAGFLGLYTYTGHLFLIGVGLSFYGYYLSKKISYIYLILLFALGIFADGHRALVVSFFLLILLLLPLARKTISIKKVLIFFALLITPLILILIGSSDWLVERFNFTAEDPSTLERFLQVPALLEKIMAHPVLGNGFGSFASVIRSQERPFSYEVDFLATIMKLGLLGSLLYFGAYIYMLNIARRFGGALGYILFCVGLSFLFYMGTNGNSAMSTDSSVFHMFLFILISLSISLNRQDVLIKQGGVYPC